MEQTITIFLTDGTEIALPEQHPKPEKLVEFSLARLMGWEATTNYRARSTDPISSHQAASAGYGLAEIADQVMWVLDERPGDWLTCDDIIADVFGPGPYTLKQAKRLNKIQTVCLKLARDQKIERREPTSAHDVLRYRRGSL
jgi:hypothetical protein